MGFLREAKYLLGGLSDFFVKIDGIKEGARRKYPQ